ncbi:SxtJ family membrane protein [Orrella marina]|uniref:SxtJ n=1 Tax=Orrella marina TaxID=2163011 RepID=A0A2R4XGV8_9BURK|nr:SxtJ family membrane protein [Orrella marina]AWB33057.1 hypothetical protein DBV39_04235 [Orrella marina]
MPYQTHLVAILALKNRETKVSNRVFGFVWCFIIGFFATLPLWRAEPVHMPTAVVAVSLALVAIVAPGLLTVPNRLWTRFGKKVNGVMSNVVLFMIYFLFITPGAALLRLCGRNQLELRFDPKTDTYWTERPSDTTNFTQPY